MNMSKHRRPTPLQNVPQQCPNIAVLKGGEDYLEAAQILLDGNRLHPAAILSALSIELFLKAFLATRIAPWTAETEHGHKLRDLFDLLSSTDRDDILRASKELEPSMQLASSMLKYNDTFECMRYPYEQEARLRGISSEIVSLAEHCRDVGWTIARRRMV